MRCDQPFPIARRRAKTTGRRAFIWSTYRAVTVPAIMGAPHNVKSLACILIQANAEATTLADAADSVVRSLFQGRAVDLPAALGRSALEDGPGPGLWHSAL